MVTQMLEHLCPSTISGRKLQNCRRGNEAVDARKDRSVPLSLGASPARRPLVTILRPFMFCDPTSPNFAQWLASIPALNIINIETLKAIHKAII